MNLQNWLINILCSNINIFHNLKKNVGTKIVTLIILSSPEAYFSMSSGYVEDLSHTIPH